jgi:hypothetical protein
LQKQVIDYCVKLGVDPKHYDQLFHEIEKMHGETEK